MAGLMLGSGAVGAEGLGETGTLYRSTAARRRRRVLRCLANVFRKYKERSKRMFVLSILPGKRDERWGPCRDVISRIVFPVGFFFFNCELLLALGEARHCWGCRRLLGCLHGLTTDAAAETHLVSLSIASFKPRIPFALLSPFAHQAIHPAFVLW